MHCVLKSALKQAVLWRLVHFNEADAAKPPKVEGQAMTTYDMPRMAAMLEAILYIPSCWRRCAGYAAATYRHYVAVHGRFGGVLALLA
jgi:hypothetical protein